MERLSLSNFYKHSRMADGHLNKCKECNKKDVRENRQNNFEHYQQYEKERAANKLAYRVEYKKNWLKEYYEDFPNKRKANAAINNAVKLRKYLKPCYCEICGSDKSVQAHHSSYTEDMWLVVTWLCSRCHVRLHADFKHKLGPWSEGV